MILEIAKKCFDPEVEMKLEQVQNTMNCRLVIYINFDHRELINVDKFKVYVENKIIGLIEKSKYFQQMNKRWC
jgi:hypothetical protein